MQRRAKRHTKNHTNNNAKRPQATNGVGLWSIRPSTDLSLLLSRVRARQLKRLHLR